jgi:hypothetical protein
MVQLNQIVAERNGIRLQNQRLFEFVQAGVHNGGQQYAAAIG